MQALVKTLRTNLNIQGYISSRVLDVLKNEYGNELKIYQGEEEYIDVTQSDWYREIKAQTTPGDAMRIYRKNRQWTQSQLGEKLGNIPERTIYNMENGKRPVSLTIAKKLSGIFDVPASRFLDL